VTQTIRRINSLQSRATVGRNRNNCFSRAVSLPRRERWYRAWLRCLICRFLGMIVLCRGRQIASALSFVGDDISIDSATMRAADSRVKRIEAR